MAPSFVPQIVLDHDYGVITNAARVRIDTDGAADLGTCAPGRMTGQQTEQHTRRVEPAPDVAPE